MLVYVVQVAKLWFTKLACNDGTEQTSWLSKLLNLIRNNNQSNEKQMTEKIHRHS